MRRSSWRARRRSCGCGGVRPERGRGRGRFNRFGCFQAGNARFFAVVFGSDCIVLRCLSMGCRRRRPERKRGMKRRIALVAALIGSIIGAMAGPVAAGELRIGGTGAVTDVLRALAPDFTAQTGIALVVIPSLGSSGANNAVADGQLGLAVSGRDLRDKEKARGLQVVGSPAHALRPRDVTPRPGRPRERRRRRLVQVGQASVAGWHAHADRAAAGRRQRQRRLSRAVSRDGRGHSAASPAARSLGRGHRPGQCRHGRADERLPGRRHPGPDQGRETQSQVCRPRRRHAQPGSVSRRLVSAMASCSIWSLRRHPAPRPRPSSTSSPVPRPVRSCATLGWSLVPGDCFAHKTSRAGQPGLGCPWR